MVEVDIAGRVHRLDLGGRAFLAELVRMNIGQRIVLYAYSEVAAACLECENRTDRHGCGRCPESVGEAMGVLMFCRLSELP